MNKTGVQHHGGLPPVRGRGPHPLSAAKQMYMHGFEGQLVTIRGGRY